MLLAALCVAWMLEAKTLGENVDADEGQIDSIIKLVVADFRHWENESAGNPIVDRDRRAASDLFIGLLLESGRLKEAERVAVQLNRTTEFWSAVHPILLSQGRFEEAIEVGNKLAYRNPRLRDFLVVDTFVAIAMQKSLKAGLDYLNQLPTSINMIDGSVYSTGLARLARFYHDQGKTSESELAFARITSQRDREIAEAIMSASNAQFNEVRVRPLFLGLLQRRSTVVNGTRTRKNWFLTRVLAYDAISKGHMAEFNRLIDELKRSQPVETLSQQDQAIGLGIDLLIHSMTENFGNDSNDTRILAKKLMGHFTLEPAASGSSYERAWIAYALSRAGYWKTSDVKAAWRSRGRRNSPEWIIGFAAGYELSGKGSIVQQLVDMTETNNARCYLRLGQLVARVSNESAAADSARQAMK